MELNGSVIYAGRASGRIHILNSRIGPKLPERAKDARAELDRFHAARDKSKRQIREIEDKMEKTAGEDCARIFQIHRIMLDDPDYVGTVREIIEREGLCAEYAVARTRDNFAEAFEELEDEYMGARDADVRDISNRVIRNLRNEKGITGELREPVVILADDLLPSELSELGRENCLAMVTRKGSFTSHVALLARVLKIPALNEVDFPEDVEGKVATVDGERGVLIVEDQDQLFL